jgi:hypothetical protein
VNVSKKIIYLLLIIFVFNNCVKVNNNIEEEKGEFVNQDAFQKIVFDSLPFDLDDTIGNVNDFFIDDKLAFEIGTAVLRNVYGNVEISDYIFQIIQTKKGDIFIVTAMPNNMIPGADYNVAISSKDGKILRIWMGE